MFKSSFTKWKEQHGIHIVYDGLVYRNEVNASQHRAYIVHNCSSDEIDNICYKSIYHSDLDQLYKQTNKLIKTLYKHMKKYGKKEKAVTCE